MRRALARLLIAALFLVLLLALGLAGWLGYASMKRSQRERMTAESLAPATGRWVEVGDSRLFVQEWGPRDGPVLLLTHGTGAWSGTWFELPDALAAAGWRVVAVDLPPFGFSVSSSRTGELDYSRPAQAARLLRLIESLGGAGEITLVGHSFGAGPALEAAVRDSSHLRRLVLVDAALGLGPAGEAPSCSPLPAWASWMFGRRDVRAALISGSATYPDFTASLLGTFVHRKDAVTPERVAAYQVPMRRFSYGADLGDWAYAFANAGCEPAASLDPQKLTAWSRGGPPVVLVWGAADTITPIAQARALMRWMPEAILVELPDLGHIPHIEDPAAFGAALLGAVGRAEPVVRPAAPGAKAPPRKDHRP
ncbi:MAG: alpha/beta hydrolase [Burkholderiales bacterium]|nr:alpha/beta hydrolase [Burkholderiales bacterium]